MPAHKEEPVFAQFRGRVEENMRRYVQVDRSNSWIKAGPNAPNFVRGVSSLDDVIRQIRCGHDVGYAIIDLVVIGKYPKYGYQGYYEGEVKEAGLTDSLADVRGKPARDDFTPSRAVQYAVKAHCLAAEECLGLKIAAIPDK
jgi:hypothetical protein